MSDKPMTYPQAVAIALSAIDLAMKAVRAEAASRDSPREGLEFTLQALHEAGRVIARTALAMMESEKETKQ